jgi:hypothetical protein
MLTRTVGRQEALLLPDKPVRVNAVRCTSRVTASAEVNCPGLKMPVPLVLVAAPDQYVTEVFGIVSSVVAPPVVNVVEVTEAVQLLAVSPRLSETRTVPSWTERVPPGPAVPRAADPGMVIVSVDCSGTGSASRAAAGVAVQVRATKTAAAANVFLAFMAAPLDIDDSTPS